MVQIQFLGHQAQTAGNLASNDKIVCREDGPNIVIASANPNVVYVPYYNPVVVYGTWPWAEYPPVYFSPGYFGLGALAAGVGWAWGPAWPIVPAFWGWYGVNWAMGGGIVVDGGGYSRIAYGNAAWGGGNWQHPGGVVSHGGFGGGMGAGSGAESMVLRRRKLSLKFSSQMRQSTLRTAGGSEENNAKPATGIPRMGLGRCVAGSRPVDARAHFRLALGIRSHRPEGDANLRRSFSRFREELLKTEFVDPPHQPESTLRPKARILVNVHPGGPSIKPVSCNPQPERTPPDEQPS